MSIEIRNVSKQFGAFLALRDVTLTIDQGELLALLGPSGCGKTTLLRIIAGLETVGSGSVLLSGEDATELHVRDRNVGFVFQHYALFRHMTVFENIAFGLRVKPRGQRLSEKLIHTKVHDLLQLVQMEWIADRFPSQLSGGQRQRIALARALAVEPKVLLLDEPFGALDAKVRKELRRWLRRLHDELGMTTIFVTHDQEEAMEVADRVVLMNQGVVEQVGTPEHVWANPASPFVYGFLGDVNLFHGRAHKGEVRFPGLRLDAPEHAQAQDTPAYGYIRPHDILVRALADSEGGEGDDGGMAATLSRVSVIGPTARLELLADAGGHIIEAHVPAADFRELQLTEGSRVLAVPRQAKVFVG